MAKMINNLAHQHSPFQVFSDFVEMSALAISNAVDITQFDKREQRYLDIVKGYRKEEVNVFPKLLGSLTMHLESNPADVLGTLYHDLELHNNRAGQYFTPFPICQMMAKMTLGEGVTETIAEQGFITVSEPACGSGAMIIAYAGELANQEINYQQHMHVTAVDLDQRCAHMAYVQFSLLHIPAVVVHGNSLTVEEYSHWYTPAHVMGGWSYTLGNRKQKAWLTTARELVSNTQHLEEPTGEHTPIQPANDNRPRPSGPGTQLKLFD